MKDYKFDRLLKFDDKYFMASSIQMVQRFTDPAVALHIFIDGGHKFEIEDADEIQSFRTQYLEFLTKNGIKLWGDL